jgi:hypothetical protein
VNLHKEIEESLIKYDVLKKNDEALRKQLHKLIVRRPIKLIPKNLVEHEIRKRQGKKTEYFKIINEVKKMTTEKDVSDLLKIAGEGKVEEFLLQNLQPDAQRLEIEEVARVIITPLGVEVYTFDDMVYMIEIGGTKIRQMEWKEKENSDVELEETCSKVMTVKQ